MPFVLFNRVLAKVGNGPISPLPGVQIKPNRPFAVRSGTLPGD